MPTSRSKATKTVAWIALVVAMGACSSVSDSQYYDYRNGYSTVYTSGDEDTTSPLSLTGHMYY